MYAFPFEYLDSEDDYFDGSAQDYSISRASGAGTGAFQNN